MPFSAIKNASAVRASIRAENQQKKREEALQKELDAKAKDEKYRQAMMAAALRYLTPEEMRKSGVIIEYGEEDPNATPRLPTYAHHTIASTRRSSVASVAKGGRRTRKRRNGKKKTMRKGGRMRKGGAMRKSGMRRHRRYSSRNKRGGGGIFRINAIDLNMFNQQTGEQVLRYNLNDEKYILGIRRKLSPLFGAYYLRDSADPEADFTGPEDIDMKQTHDQIVGEMVLSIPDDESSNCTLKLTVKSNIKLNPNEKHEEELNPNEKHEEELIISRKVAEDLYKRMGLFYA
jgi:hypothetical protein